MVVIRVSLKHYGILEEIAQYNDTNIMIIADELLEIGLRHSKYQSYSS
jgi:hypothetical protein